MQYDIEHEMLGTILSYAGIALDQPDAETDPSRVAFLHEYLERVNMQLYSAGRVTIISEEEEDAFFALAEAAKQYLEARYEKCVATDGAESGFAKQLDEDVAIVKKFIAFAKSGSDASNREPRTEEGISDMALMAEIIFALSGMSAANPNALIDEPLRQEIESMLLKHVRERLGIDA